MSSKYSLQQKLDMIMECRSSGLTDHQWCEQNNIGDSTFYYWINQLKKTGAVIPSHATSETIAPSLKQDVVRVDIVQSDDLVSSPPEPECHCNNVVEIAIGKAVIKISNEISKDLLVNLMSCLGGRL